MKATTHTYDDAHILQMNIGMWLKHQKWLLRWFKSAWAFFLCSNPKYFRENAEVQSYIDYIRKENPDIVYLTEVCGHEQRDKIMKWLEGMGYYVHSIPWFELWSMHDESHKYLYHITASKKPMTHIGDFKQYTHSGAIRFLKWIWWLGKNIPESSPDTADKVAHILDGAGSHFVIDGLQTGVIHLQTQDTVESLRGLMKSLSEKIGKNWTTILTWDLNARPALSEGLAQEIDPRLIRIKTWRTFPFIFADTPGWLAHLARKLAKKYLFRDPDQVFTDKPYRIPTILNRWPKETWLGTDHSVNHIHIDRDGTPGIQLKPIPHLDAWDKQMPEAA